MSASQTATVTPMASAPENLGALMRQLGQKAQAAARIVGVADRSAKDRALHAAAAAIRDRASALAAANDLDMEAAAGRGLRASLIDRLKLTPDRIEAMAAGLEAIAELPDPIGDVLDHRQRPNGLDISRVRVPLGVIGVIYESRPNVTADAGGLCLKAGNAVILRGGSESFHSARAIADCLTAGLHEADLPADAIQLIPTTDRAAVGHLLGLTDFVDVIVPRGGANLIRRVAEESRIPVFKHLDGICHVYVHRSADARMAAEIVVNAKMRRTGICGSAETLLIDAVVAPTVLPPILDALATAGCSLRGDAATQALDARVEAAVEGDWSTEYLDSIISIRQITSVSDAVSHINHYGSHHTDSIIASDTAAADRFCRDVDSAIVMHNTSTQFADGGEFGMGAEIGISTGKLHARGPVGVEQLTSMKYVVRGSGQTRP